MREGSFAFKPSHHRNNIIFNPNFDRNFCSEFALFLEIVFFGFLVKIEIRGEKRRQVFIFFGNKVEDIQLHKLDNDLIVNFFNRRSAVVSNDVFNRLVDKIGNIAAKFGYYETPPIALAITSNRKQAFTHLARNRMR